MTLLHLRSIDEKKQDEVIAEIQAAGGDVLGVAGDVGAEDFPKKIVEATVKCVSRSISFFLAAKLYTPYDAGNTER
jgi:hypothetical protein